MAPINMAEFDPDGPAEGDGIYGLDTEFSDATVVILPVPWEATVSYRAGTAEGPRAILEASKQVELFDPDTGEPWRAGITMLPEDSRTRRDGRRARRIAAPVIRAGGAGSSTRLRKKLEIVNGLCEELHERVYAETKPLIRSGKLVALLGGDHSTPFGLIRALAEEYPGLGVLQLDAHADLRDAYEGFIWSHASIMHNVTTRLSGVTRLVQLGLRDVGAREHAVIKSSRGRITALFHADFARARLEHRSFQEIVSPYIERLPENVYLSFDIDGLDPALCPNTGTPVPGGFQFTEACEILRIVVESGRRIVGFDLNEVAPGERDDWDANVGARILYKMIGYALISRRAARSRGANPGKQRKRRSSA